jgi:uncharacterized protein (DUF58 family)
MNRPLALLGVAAALAALAGAVPAPALMPVALALAVLTAGAWAAVALAARRVTVTRRLAVHEAREHEPIRLAFAVAGRGRLPVMLEARTGTGAWAPLGGRLELTCPRRGEYRLAPSQLRVRDRLGIARRDLTAGSPERVLILPAPDDRLLRAPPAGPALGDPEPDGLEAYVPGTPLARIHWPTLARGAGLHARRVAPGSHQLPLVVVDTSGPVAPGAIDWAARTAAGHVLRYLRSGGCRVRLPGDRLDTTVADLAAWRRLHRRLALLEPAPATPAPPAALRIAAVAAVSVAPAPPAPYGVEPYGGG